MPAATCPSTTELERLFLGGLSEKTVDEMEQHVQGCNACAASASAGKRFLREAEAMAAVEHDHIVRIYLVDEDRGVPFMAMEFLKGEPLDERLKSETQLPLDEVLRIGREMAEGLAAAHATGLIHRDIKPGNIWLEAPRNRVKILDFGLARAASQDAGLTQQGAIIGTPAYMAPEQGRGESVDARCDLFSLGVVLYRLCTRQQPFKGTDTVSTLMAVALDNPPAPIQLNAALPAELSALVMKLLEKDPGKRIASAAEVVKSLQALEQKLARQKASEENTLALHPTASASRGKQPSATPAKQGAPSRRPLLVMAIVAVTVLVALVGGGIAALVYLKAPPGKDKESPGAFVIDTNDDDFTFNVNKEGGVTLKDKKTNREYKLTVVREDKDKGKYELEVTDVGGDLTFKTKSFTIKRGDMVVASLWFERKSAKVTPPIPDEDKITDAWIQIVAAQPADKQVEMVSAKLKKLNPDFNGEVTPRIIGKVVTSITFVTDKVTDLSPVRALTELRGLNCSAPTGMGKLSDVAPLKDLKLTHLDCSGNPKLTSLAPLKDMKLASLTCNGTQVTDLTPLKDMKLEGLSINSTPVFDLSPLKAMPLTFLECGP